LNDAILDILQRTFSRLHYSNIDHYYELACTLLDQQDPVRIALRKCPGEELLCVLSACLALCSRTISDHSHQSPKYDSLVGRRFYYTGLETRARQIPVLEGFRMGALEFSFPIPATGTRSRGTLKRTCSIETHRFVEISQDYARTNSLTKKQMRFLDTALAIWDLICSEKNAGHLISKERIHFTLDVISDNVNSLFGAMSGANVILPDDSKIPMHFLFPSVKPKHVANSQSSLLIPVINVFSSFDQLLRHYSEARSDLLIIDGTRKSIASTNEIADAIDTDILPPTILLYQKLCLDSIRFFNNSAVAIYSDSESNTSFEEIVLEGNIAQLLSDIYVLSRELNTLNKSYESYDLLHRARRALISVTTSTEELNNEMLDIVGILIPEQRGFWNLPGNLSSLVERIERFRNNDSDNLSGEVKSNYLQALLCRDFDKSKYYAIAVDEADKAGVERIISEKGLNNVDVLSSLEGRYDKEYEEVYLFFWNADHADSLLFSRTKRVFHVLYPLESKWRKHHLGSFKPIRYSQYERQSQGEAFDEMELAGSLTKMIDIHLDSYVDSESSDLADSRDSNFEGYRIDLSNDKCFYSTDRSRLRRVNYSEEIIESVSPNDLEVGDTVVFFTGTDMEIIDSVFENMVARRPDKYLEIKKLSSKWRDALFKIKFENLSRFAARLNTSLGYKHPFQTIRRWKDDTRSIRPQKLEVIDLIGEFTEDEDFRLIKDSVKAACKGAMALRLMIGKSLISRTSRSLLDENDRIAPEIEDIMNSGSLIFAEITAIKRELNIPGNLKNRFL